MSAINHPILIFFVNT